MRKATSKRPVAPTPSQAATEVESKRWLLKLYIAGAGVKSRMAFANLKQICEQHLAGQYQIEVIDLFESPQLAKGDQILAIPTVVRRLPAPIRKVIGDLSNAERVFVGLDIKPLPV